MKKCFFSVFLMLPLFLFAQEQEIKLQWVDGDSLLYFNGASSQLDASLPVYSALLPWSDASEKPELSIKNIKSSSVDKNKIHLLEPATITAAPKLDYAIVFENSIPKLQLSVNPFFKDENGTIQKIESFSLEINSTEEMARLKAVKKGKFSGSSLLSEHNWYKIAIEKSGIHKLSYENLSELGLSNPAMVKIYGAGAVSLPEDYSKGSYDDLSELPFYMSKGGDGLFGPGDYILFYARGPVSWHYDEATQFFHQEIHPYSTRGYYFLTDGKGTADEMASVPVSTANPDYTVSSYDLLRYHEEETYNLLLSGREWYGTKFGISLTAAYPFTLNKLITSEPVKIMVTAAGRSNESSAMEVKANGSLLGQIDFGTVNLSSYTATFALEYNESFTYNSNQEVVTVQLEYLQPNTNSEAWLNSIAINARARLEMLTNELTFRDASSVNFGSTSAFSVSNASQQTLIWDITDPAHPQNVPFTLNGSTASFKLATDSLREFIAFNTNGSFPVPAFNEDGLGLIPNQNLHGDAPPDMIIVYAEEFKDQVDSLEQHRELNDNLDVLSITQEMIYNEYSSGTPDVGALRNYLKMYYDNDPATMPQFLLLFGDGSYDNRDTTSTNPNKILTYQSVNSLVPTSSYVSDDFFGLLDTGERLYDGLLDIGIGRLPVSDPDEAQLLVDKIIQYDSEETIGEWRNYICLIADDEDNNLHMKQANSLAEYVITNYPNYNINKIFLDAYPQETTPTGDLYPDVTRAINEQMSRGALIVNYTGHGSITGLAHEKIIDVNTILGWENNGKLPLFMTATCEFSRYDEYTVSTKAEKTSAGEEVLLSPNGGGIALFTTTRLVYSGPNHVLNEKFYERVFEKDSEGNCYRLGDIIKYSKNNAGAGLNKRNFTLLGDPSMRLSFPENLIITDSINHKDINSSTDTISALDFVTISGHLTDQSGNQLSKNGTVIPIVYDKESNLKTLANDGGSSFEFQYRNSIIYKGNVSVENGYFTFSFYVPKDISYQIDQGKISYYYFDDESDGHGSTFEFQIGGLGEYAELDTAGPNLELFINDTLFRNGGIVTNNPELLVFVNDSYGINTTGNGIGHDITATLNEDRINSIILNEYYVSDKDSFSSGSIRYPYSKLENGKHSIQVKVWDIFNNSSVETIEFVVVENEALLLEQIFNYPNPFVDETYFNIEHNKAGSELETTVTIYDINGNLVTILRSTEVASGYRVYPISWDGKTQGGATLGSGIYVYKVQVKTEEGEIAGGSGKLIIKR